MLLLNFVLIYKINSMIGKSRSAKAGFSEPVTVRVRRKAAF